MFRDEIGGLASRLIMAKDERPQGTLPTNFIRTSIYDKYSGSMKFTTHLDHVSHCETASGRIDAPTEYLSWILAAIDREGFRESKRCSRDTYPESYITEYILIYENKCFFRKQADYGQGRGLAKDFCWGNFTRTSIYDKYSGSMKITTHLDHISHIVKQHLVQMGRIDGPIISTRCD